MNALLDWYDANARSMPWRIGPTERKKGQRPDPYRVWLSEVMLQQTTVAAVKEYFNRFTTRWPTVTDLANADDGDVMAEWAGLGYYARARNLLKCARMVASDFDGQFPDNTIELLKLPGIGPYTAAAISSIAFDNAATVVDGNVERVMSRLYAVQTPLPAAKPELTELAAKLTPQARSGDHAQAVMDLGATICTPKSPSCVICPLLNPCEARKTGIQAELPKKTPKAPKPTRHGYIYLVQREDGAWLLERRPDKGLLGGTLGWPGSVWEEDPIPNPPIDADWRTSNQQVRHTFTHFHLILTVLSANVSKNAASLQGDFVPLADFSAKALPTVMRKAYELAQNQQLAALKTEKSQ
ncbi:A/G-specific adenine glycosylase [Cochlodiniinecator piscidefendens]|uniref:A/G-specific adenine glycosylase n=1 Tax=Cochlodiniinecator piscidefendens TaxID=2715756 RepID=UPI0014094AD9|nr:A/G-specific adenine glycosylase [Cochlodiniinecator piscidefendens]